MAEVEEQQLLHIIQLVFLPLVHLSTLSQGAGTRSNCGEHSRRRKDCNQKIKSGFVVKPFANMATEGKHHIRTHTQLTHPPDQRERESKTLFLFLGTLLKVTGWRSVKRSRPPAPVQPVMFPVRPGTLRTEPATKSDRHDRDGRASVQ